MTKPERSEQPTQEEIAREIASEYMYGMKSHHRLEAMHKIMEAIAEARAETFEKAAEAVEVAYNDMYEYLTNTQHREIETIQERIRGLK